MPTRTAFVITIGDVIESGPPQTRSNSSGNPTVNTMSTMASNAAGGSANAGSAGGGSGPITDSNRNSKRVSNRSLSNGGAVGARSASRASSTNGGGHVTNGVGGHGDSDLSDLSEPETQAGDGGKRSSHVKTRHISASSTSSLTNGNHYSNPLNGKAAGGKGHQRAGKVTKVEYEDDEVSFSDSAFNEVNGSDGVNGRGGGGHVDKPGPACSKLANRKRKSQAEKFLEDNESYYEIQVLPHKLRNQNSSSSSIPPFHNANSSFAPARSSSRKPPSGSYAGLISDDNSDTNHDESNDNDPDGDDDIVTEDSADQTRHGQNLRPQVQQPQAPSSSSGVNKKKKEESLGSPTLTNGRGGINHNVISSGTKRQRLASSSSVHSNPPACDPSKALRVNIKKMSSPEVQAALSAGSADETDAEEEDSARNKSPKRRRKTQSRGHAKSSPMSPGRGRRSELDKLLEAGSSSFHFETAKQTADRLGVLHVSVAGKDETSSEDESAGEEEEEPKIVSPRSKKANPPNPKQTKQTAAKKGKRAALSKTTWSKNQRLLKQVSPRPPTPKGGSPSKKGSQSGKAQSKSEEVAAAGREEDDDDTEGSDAEETAEDEGGNASAAEYLSATVKRELEAQLSRCDGEEVDVEGFVFSFERTPLYESWFQTYTRQDQGDEILYYPEPKSFALPYEMPASTWYPRKPKPEAASKADSAAEPSKAGPPLDQDKSQKKGRSSTQASSGAATPDTRPSRSASIPQTPVLTPGVKLDGRTKEAKAAKMQAAAAQHAALSKLLLQASADRKSPRCHASTKSLISTVQHQPGGGSSAGQLHPDEDSMDAAVDSFKPFLDECSNDSFAAAAQLQNSSASKTGWNGRTIPPVTESVQQLKDIEAGLDAFLTEADPDLEAQTSEAAGGSSKRSSPIPPPPLASMSADRPSTTSSKASTTSSSSSGASRQRQNSGTDRPHRPHKHKHRSKRLSSKAEHMDYLVALNVDQVLLDCLEEELPSVTFPDQVPGSEPLELIENFHACTSMRHGKGSHWHAKQQSSTNLKSPTISRKNSLAVSEEDHESAHDNLPSSTILKRLLTGNARTSTSPKKKAVLPDDSQEVSGGGSKAPVKPTDYSSSEETGSVCSTSTNASSTLSSASRKKKRKRNMTGFPSPKKKKPKLATAKDDPRQPLLTAVLKQNQLKNQKSKSGQAKLKTPSPNQREKVALSKKGPSKASPKSGQSTKKGSPGSKKSSPPGKAGQKEVTSPDFSKIKDPKERVAAINKARASVPGFKFRGYESEESDEEVLPVSKRLLKETSPETAAGGRRKSAQCVKESSKKKKQQQRSESDDEADAESGPEGDEEGTEEEEEDTDEPKVVKVVSPKPKQAKKPRKKKLMRTRPVPRIRRVKS